MFNQSIIAAASSPRPLNGLVSWWDLDETSGTRYDSHGSVDLTDTNTVGYAAGKQGNAADFEEDNSETLLNVSGAGSLHPGSGDFTAAIWIKPETLTTGAMEIFQLSQDEPNPAYHTFRLLLLGTDFATYPSQLDFIAYENNDSTPTFTRLKGEVTAVAGTWMFCVFDYQASSRRMRISCNNGTTYETTLPSAVQNAADSFYLGSSDAINNLYDGLIDSVGVWHRILSDDEVAWLYNEGSGRQYADVARLNLLQGLVSYWDLDETSGTRYDSHGSYDLTDTNTVAWTASGKVGNAADFEYNNTESLDRASSDAVFNPSGSFTVAGWMNAESTVNPNTAIGKVGSGDDWGWSVQSNPSGSLRAIFSDDGVVANVTVADSGTTPSTGTWYHIVAYYNADTSKCGIIVNDGTPVETAFTGPIYASTGALAIGRRSGPNTLHMDGLLDSWGFWSRTLSPDEITWLYNNSNGRQYSDL